MPKTEVEWIDYTNNLIQSAGDIKYRLDIMTGHALELEAQNEKLHEELARCHSQMESMAKQINELTGSVQ